MKPERPCVLAIVLLAGLLTGSPICSEAQSTTKPVIIKTLLAEATSYQGQDIAVVGIAKDVSSTPKEDTAKNPFLRPYVAALKAETPPAVLKTIRDMGKSELIRLHHGYGTGIRNKWLWGDRDPELVRFFRERGINHPDDMSMLIIDALWYDLNSNLSPEQRASIEVKRALVERRRSTYEKLESEGEAQLKRSREHCERCYTNHGLPSENPLNRDPFYQLVVEKTGHVREIVFFEGASPELKACLQEIIQPFHFQPFADDETVTLYILEFPHLRASERDTLHVD